MIVYKGIGPEAGKVVSAGQALEYAMEQCGIVQKPGATIDPEFAEMLVEWYYSGNWIKDVDAYGYYVLNQCGLQPRAEGAEPEAIEALIDWYNGQEAV